MKFKIDENLPIEAATTLRDAGFDAETIRDERLSGADDQVVAHECKGKGGSWLRSIWISPISELTHRSSTPESWCCG